MKIGYILCSIAIAVSLGFRSEPATEEPIILNATVSDNKFFGNAKPPVAIELAPKKAIDPIELEMLAIVIYQEAGGDNCCDDCRRRIADIVLNRVAHEKFPNTIEEVLTGKSQYGNLHWTGIVWADRAKNPVEARAVERAYRIAEEVLSGQHSELYGNGYIWQAGFKQGTDGFWCCGHWYGR